MTELSVAEQRYQAVSAVISDGLSVSQAADSLSEGGGGLNSGIEL
ncbi:MAG TPA: hypothetical protein VH084_22985 [Mycobacterium sp.]|jgi:hypothetical protein|nr:hypothetical protein [Mycobacterium sp.]